MIATPRMNEMLDRLYEIDHDQDKFYYFECTRTTCRQIIERLYQPKSGTKIVVVPKWIAGAGILHQPLLRLHCHYNVTRFPNKMDD
jgi:hypothetical protein